MLLSASVNLFDGEELLGPLVRVYRALVEHLTVVYQSRSWRGAPAPAAVAPTLERLVAGGWIDEAVRCDAEPEEAQPKRHEALKRTVGLDLARRAGATHFLSLDVDEFYRPEEFRAARSYVEAEGLDATACRVQDYHRRSIYRCVGLATCFGADLYVPFITAVGPGTRYDATLDYFCAVDPSRRTMAARSHAFAPSALLMHHMTTVRASVDSLTTKFANSTSRPPVCLEEPDLLARHVWQFDPRLDRAPVVDVVDDEFGIEPWTGGAGLATSLVPTSTHFDRRRA